MKTTFHKQGSSIILFKTISEQTQLQGLFYLRTFDTKTDTSKEI